MALSPSEVAGLVYLIRTNIVGLQGVSPPPLPAIAITPYVTVHQILNIGLESLSGPSGMVKSLMQVNVWSKDYEVAWSFRESIREFILAFTGNVGNGRIIEAANCNAGFGAGNTELFDNVRLYHQLISRILIWWT